MSNNKKWLELLAQAEKLTQEERWEELLSVVSEIIELTPDDPTAYNNRGFSKNNLKDFQGAIDDFNKAVELMPDFAEAYNNRGFAKNGLNDFQGAIDDYDKALELYPHYAEAIHNKEIVLAVIESSKGKESRMSDNKRLLELLWGQANKLTQEGHWKELLSVLSEIIKLTPKDPKAYNNRGFSKNNLKDFQGAIKDFNKALELKSNYAVAYNNRGFSKNRLKDFQGAIEDFNKALDLKPNSVSYNNRGYAKIELEDFQGAIDDYSKVLDNGDKGANVYFNRGVAKFKLKKYLNSIEDIDRVIELGTTDDNSYTEVARLTKNIEKDIRAIIFQYIVKISIAISDFKIHLSEKPESDHVFHYTGLEALKALSEGGKFRLYNASYMNDPQEGEVFFDMLCEGGELQDFFYPQNKNILTSAYVASFVIEDERKDKQQNGDIMFWRTYGKHSNTEGAGACLKFQHTIFSNTRKNDFPQINALTKPDNISNINFDSAVKEENTLIKVLYVDKGKLINSDTDMFKKLEDISTELKNIQKFCSKTNTRKGEGEAKKIIRLLTCAYLDKVRFFFKNQAYSYEKEARIVMFKWIGEEGDLAEDVIIVSPESKDGMPHKLYMELPETVRCNEVILGPKTPHRDEWRAWLRRQPWHDKTKSIEPKPIIPVNKSNIKMR